MHGLRKFRDCRSGNVAMLFALTVIPMFGLAGLAVDYIGVVTQKALFESAADAAVLAATTKARKDIVAGVAANTAIADGVAAGTAAFMGQTATTTAVLTQPFNLQLTRSGQTFTATATFNAARGAVFGRFFGIPLMNFAGGASANVTLPQYLNFYLALDMSASMGIPSTASEIARLAVINPDFRTIYPGGCTIACHFTAYKACTDTAGNTSWCQGYNLTRTGGGAGPPVSFCAQPGQSNCIQLRLDAITYAVQQLMTLIQATETGNGVANEFGVGIYPFIAYLRTLQTLTTNMTQAAATAANLTSLIDNGDPNNGGGLGSGGTHFENALPALNSIINNIGDGSSAASPQPYVFLITDGAQNNQYQLGNGNWTGSNHATTLDPSNCATMKSRGITIGVLYVPYVPIPNPTTIWGDEDDYANANIPNIPPALRACASPNFFFTASTPADINTALQGMFRLAAQQPRLTH